MSQVVDAATAAYAVHAIFPDGSSGFVPASGIAWEELSGEVATRITVTMPDTDLDDGRRLTDLVTIGTPLTVQAAVGDGAALQECARGVVEELQPDDGTQGTFQVIAYDPIRALLANKDDAYYDPNQTPLAIIQDLFGPTKWNVPMGSIDESLGTVTLPVQVFKAETLADILLSLMQQAYDQMQGDAVRLVARTTSGLLEIVRPGQNQTVYWLVQGESITRVPERISTVDFINRVVIIGPGGTNIASPQIATLDSTVTWTDPNDRTIFAWQVGRRQDMMIMPIGKTTQQVQLAAQKMLDQSGRPRYDRTVEAPDVPYVRKFDKARVFGGTMDGYFSVESATHDEPSGTMRLVIGNLSITPVPSNFVLLQPDAFLDTANSTTTSDSTQGPYTGGNLSDAQRYQAALAAGFSGHDAVVATAISIAEDQSGDPNAKGGPNQDGSYDLGLWQVNQQWWSQFGGEAALTDPTNNANAAYAIFQKQGFGAWSTYKYGQYASFMNRAQLASTTTADPLDYQTIANTGAGAQGNSAIVTAAQSWLGVPYLYGGNTRAGIDCSGLTQQVYRSVGVSLTRTAQQQFDQTTPVANPQVGDLVFFKGTDPNSADTITHVGIFVGNGQMINAPEPGQNVQYSNLNSSYWQSHIAGYGRAPGVSSQNS